MRLSTEFIDYPWLTHLGACQAAAVLLARGWRVELLDGLAGPDAALLRHADHAWLGRPARPFLDRLAGLRADLTVVAGSPFLTTGPGRPWLARLLDAVPAAAGTLACADLVVGGMHYVEYDGAALLAANPRLDLLLRYEAEPLLDRLATELEAGVRPARAVRENRVAFPLDDVPLPAYELLDAPAVFGFLRRVLATPWRPGPFPPEPAETLPLVTTRGCPYGCIFCSKNPGLPEPRRQVRSFPWVRVERDVGRWVRTLGLRRLVVLDELANLDERRFDRLLALAERHGLRLEFPNGLRADRLQRRHVRRLRPLVSTLKVSLESAVPRVQRRVLHKNLDPAAVERVAAWCAAEGVPLGVHGMIGIPGERRAEIVRTIRFLARLRRTRGVEPLLQLAVPLPGTELARRAGTPADDDADLHAAFRTGGLTTREFDPAFLRRALAALDAPDAATRERKVIVNLTYRCNNRCVFCAVGDRPARDARTADVLAALRRHRERGFDLLDIDGGEPTLHPDLTTLVAAARDLGYARIAVTTNGRTLSLPGVAAALVRAGVTEVLVSLHAPTRARQEELTRAPGSFAQTVTGLRSLLAAAGDDVRVAVNTTVVRRNLAALPALARLLARLGVARWNVQVVTPFGRARASHVPSEAALRRHLGALLDGAPPGLAIQVVNCPPCLLPGHERAALADFGKAERAMVFVGETGVNLQTWLAKKRRRDARCRGCPFAAGCPGFYRFDAVTRGTGRAR
ncbi:MAG: radical SAM protein [Deltaproteobacteria bacterium]|nr:radical SAM protein [Deltaproteobacteria bacterium]